MIQTSHNYFIWSVVARFNYLTFNALGSGIMRKYVNL